MSVLSPVLGQTLRPLALAISSALGTGGAFNPASQFAANEPGWVYDLDDFVEPTLWRVNLLLWSEQLQNAVWSVQNATKVGNIITATAASGKVQQALAVPAGSTTSFWVKRGTAAVIEVDIGSAAFQDFTLFNLDTLAVTLRTNNTAANIVDEGNGVFRLTVTRGSTAGTRVSVSPTNTGETVEFVKAQLQSGSSFTEYQRITDFNSDFLAAYPRTVLFADNAGTAPASVNGAAGLVLDKRLGLVPGSELLPGTAVAYTGNGTISVSGNTITATCTTDGAYGIRFNGLVNNIWTKCAFEVVTNSASKSLNFYPNLVHPGVSVGTTTGSKSYVLLAPPATGSAQNPTFFISGLAGESFSVRAVSVRELPGNHAYQNSAPSRPVLRGTPVGGSLVANGDFAGGTTGWSVALNVSISVSGGALRATSNGSSPSLVQQAVATTIGRVYRLKARYVGGTAATPVFRVGSTSVGNNLVSLVGTAAAAVIERYFTATSSTTYINFGSQSSAAGEYSDWDDVELHDVTADAVTAPYALQFDGLDDFLQTASIDLSGTDKVFLCAGVRKLSDAVGIIAELSTGIASNVGSFYLVSGTDGGGTGYTSSSRGSATSVLALAGRAFTFTAPDTAVLSATHDISGDRSRIWRNSVVGTDGTGDKGTGNFGNYAVFIGRRGGTTHAFNGLLFSSICRGGTLPTAALISQYERWVAQRTGVTL